MVPLMTQFASYDTDASTSGITWPEKSCNTLVDCLNLWNTMVPLMILMISSDLDGRGHDMKLLKSPVAPHFDCLDLRNAVVPLTTLSVLKGCQGWFQWCQVTQNYICTPFWSCWPMESSGIIDGTVHITWCWHQCIGIIWHEHQCYWHHVIPILMSMASHDQESHIAHHFNCLDLKKCNSAIDGTVCMMWHWYQCQWHQVTKRSYFTSFVLSWPKGYNDSSFDTIGNMCCQQKWPCNT